mmetsp:Transcript_17537/g.43730  ORF Transcript_17537/g.43730 Transcript_17537/m.43730 type:complete len:276 (+) Transcript_17537:2310-3137(+)
MRSRSSALGGGPRGSAMFFLKSIAVGSAKSCSSVGANSSAGRGGFSDERFAVAFAISWSVNPRRSWGFEKTRSRQLGGYSSAHTASSSFGVRLGARSKIFALWRRKLSATIESARSAGCAPGAGPSLPRSARVVSECVISPFGYRRSTKCSRSSSVREGKPDDAANRLCFCLIKEVCSRSSARRRSCWHWRRRSSLKGGLRLSSSAVAFARASEPRKRWNGIRPFFRRLQTLITDPGGTYEVVRPGAGRLNRYAQVASMSSTFGWFFLPMTRDDP